MMNISSTPQERVPNDPTAPVDPVNQGRVGDLDFQAAASGAQSSETRSALNPASLNRITLPFGEVKLYTKDGGKPRLALLQQTPRPDSAAVPPANQTHIDDLEHRIYTSATEVQEKMRKERELAGQHLQHRSVFPMMPLPSTDDPRSTDGEVRLSGDSVLPREVQALGQAAWNDRLNVNYGHLFSGAGVASKMNVKMEEQTLRVPHDRILVDYFEIPGDGRKHGIHLHALFAGQLGPACAEHAKRVYSSILQKNLEKFSQGNLSDMAVFNALKTTSVEVSRTMDPQQSNAGATANVTLVIDDKAWISTLGHSGALFVSPDRMEQLSDPAEVVAYNAATAKYTTEHRYTKSATTRGGRTIGRRLGGMLPVTRALGFNDIDGVSARPKVFSIPLPAMNDREGCYLVQFTRGANHSMNEITIGQRVRQRHADGHSPAHNAEQIVEEAAYRGSRYDISVLVIPLDRLQLPHWRG